MRLIALVFFLVFLFFPKPHSKAEGLVFFLGLEEATRVAALSGDADLGYFGEENFQWERAYLQRDGNRLSPPHTYGRTDSWGEQGYPAALHPPLSRPFVPPTWAGSTLGPGSARCLR